MPGDQPPVTGQSPEELARVQHAPPLRTRVAAGQVDAPGVRCEQQVPGVVDSVPVEGDVTGCVAGRVRDPEPNRSGRPSEGVLLPNLLWLSHEQ